jgi:hypothetical protein
MEHSIEACHIKIVRAMNKGKFHTSKYHRRTRAIRLTEADVDRLLFLKRSINARDEDWMFPNRIKNGTKACRISPCD